MQKYHNKTRAPKITLAVWHRANPQDIHLQELENGSTICIGASRECEIVIKDNFVSRRHASVICKDDKILLRDEDSINGILLFRGGECISVHSAMRRIVHNDVFAVGEHIFRLRTPEGSISDSSIVGGIEIEKIAGSSADILAINAKNSLIANILSFFSRSKERTPTSKSMRLVINNILTTDSDLDAFVLDYYPRIKSRFSSGMDRTAKVTLLLELADRRVLLEQLRRDDEGLYQAVSGLLSFE